MKKFLIIIMTAILFNSCANPKESKGFDAYPTPINENLWPTYTKEVFHI